MKNSLTLKQTESISSTDWTNLSLCRDHLEVVMDRTQSPSSLVAASQFAKRYASLVVVPALTLMTMENKEMNVSIHNCHLDMDVIEGKWTPSLRFIDASESSYTTGSRENWREQLMETLFAGHVSKMWRTLHDVSGVPMSLLWENTAVRVFSLYEKKLRKNVTLEEQKRVEADFHYLIHEAPGEIFGEKRNPLKPFYTPKDSESQVRVRQTCCYYYQTGAGGKYCGVCPKK